MVLRRLLLGLVLVAANVSVAVAGKGEIRFVETNVDLRADGSAVVAYTVQWAVISGELHGFYFHFGAGFRNFGRSNFPTS